MFVAVKLCNPIKRTLKRKGMHEFINIKKIGAFRCLYLRKGDKTGSFQIF